ncbi:hypothetical protein NPIL_646101 [Nephila pilipes]|uniref:Uncharacterized protein n=1 Tax=Nephila pilipes TaxID=299642 RepID=A0A8X6N861_NEPPI|nr:hypothetical protein NPIL_646101 [Nephila pilipes]
MMNTFFGTAHCKTWPPLPPKRATTACRAYAAPPKATSPRSGYLGKTAFCRPPLPFANRAAAKRAAHCLPYRRRYAPRVHTSAGKTRKRSRAL